MISLLCHLVWITLGRESTVEGFKTGLCGDITIVVACDGVRHLVIVLISASQLSWSLSVLVLYLSSVNRGTDN